MGGKVKVVVEFPFQGYFFWHWKNWKSFHTQPGYETLSENVRNQLYSFFDKNKHLFADKVLKSLDEVWVHLDRDYPILGDRNYKLSDDEKLAVASMLVVASSRHKEGSLSYKDGKFIKDPFTKRTLILDEGLTLDEYVAVAYKETGVKALAVTVEDGEPYEVKNADVIFKQVQERRKVELTKAESIRTGVVTLIVHFPYRALYRWDFSAFERFRTDPRTQKLDSKGLKEINKFLSTQGVFARQGIVAEYDSAWWATGEVYISGATRNAPVYMTDIIKQALVDALMIPGTRGVQGNASYKDRSQPHLGFIGDSWLDREVTVPYRVDGDYVEAVKLIVGDTIFWYEEKY